jgi:predicted ATPase
MPDFETIYRAAKVPVLAHGYTIDKVAAMLQNPRLSGMSASVKANSVLMALEVAGVAIDDVVADAVARDRAIDDFEAWWTAKVARIESEKRAENAAIEDEMNRYLEAQRNRIRANNAAVQQAQETFASWKDRKREEEQRLYDSVQPFVTENPVTLNTGAIGAAPPGTRTH